MCVSVVFDVVESNIGPFINGCNKWARSGCCSRVATATGGTNVDARVDSAPIGFINEFSASERRTAVAISRSKHSKRIQYVLCVCVCLCVFLCVYCVFLCLCVCVVMVPYSCISGSPKVASSFGVSLSDLCVHRSELPLVVSYSLAYLSAFLDTPGLFQQSSPSMKQKIVVAQAAWNESNRLDADPLVVSELLKVFVLSLPEPLCCGIGVHVHECVQIGYEPYVSPFPHLNVVVC
jgi:hypothetical protein